MSAALCVAVLGAVAACDVPGGGTAKDEPAGVYTITSGPATPTLEPTLSEDAEGRPTLQVGESSISFAPAPEHPEGKVALLSFTHKRRPMIALHAIKRGGGGYSGAWVPEGTAELSIEAVMRDSRPQWLESFPDSETYNAKWALSEKAWELVGDGVSVELPAAMQSENRTSGAAAYAAGLLETARTTLVSPIEPAPLRRLVLESLAKRGFGFTTQERAGRTVVAVSGAPVGVTDAPPLTVDAKTGLMATVQTTSVQFVDAMPDDLARHLDAMKADKDSYTCTETNGSLLCEEATEK